MSKKSELLTQVISGFQPILFIKKALFIAKTGLLTVPTPFCEIEKETLG
jgi:hypothetical protein